MVTAATQKGHATISRLTQKYFTEGLDGLVKTGHSSNRYYMTYDEAEEFLAPYREAADKGLLVTAQEMHRAYNKRIGHKATLSGFYFLLQRHHWCKIMPWPHHPKQADAKTKEASKKLTPKSTGY
ncbi:MAG: hypothetical protein ABF915_12495 [Schleiferilactobacillus harbinensis]|jgi:hypothetical protein